MLQLNILPAEISWASPAQQVLPSQDGYMGAAKVIWNLESHRRCKLGYREEVVANPLWRQYKVNRVRGCPAEPLPFLFGADYWAGQGWPPCPSWVTVDITVENSPKMCSGELAEAVEPSWCTEQLQKSWGIKFTKEEEWSPEWINTCSYFFLFAYGSLCSLPSQSDGETVMRSV